VFMILHLAEPKNTCVTSKVSMGKKNYKNTQPLLWAMVIVSIISFCVDAKADETIVAVAANFTVPAREIAKEFSSETGHKAILSFGSTGKLYAQIVHGAPFHVFLSADRERAKLAIDNNLAVAGSRITYAVGKIVLYSSDPSLVDNSAKVLLSDRYARLAIANPKIAPYGRAAIEVIENLGLLNHVQNRIVQGDSISQVHQFVASGNAELGFVAHSQVNKNSQGSMWIVPQKMYSPIEQDAVLLKTGQNNKAAVAFMDFMASSKFRDIIASHGYDAGLPHQKGGG